MPSTKKLAAALVVLASLIGSSAGAQAPAPAAPSAAPPAAAAPLPPLPAGQTPDPFPQPIVADRDVIAVTLQEFASFPEIDGVPARLMTLVDEPTSRRLFVSDMRGILYTVSHDGKTVTPYLDIRDPKVGVSVQAQGRERGVQSFVLHPQFARAGTPGYGKFYAYVDVTSQTPAAPANFTTPNPTSTHDAVLLEWTAKSPGAARYDGGAPREIIRWRHPYANHNGGAIAFNSTAQAGAPDYGLLYVGVADGGSGGDPMNLAQNLGSSFGKILRIDPLGKNGGGGKYGVPASNPFVSRSGALPEIYAYGIRNAQRFGWDPKNGQMYLSDIGQNIVEEVSPVTAGGNLGWNTWEGSYKYVSQRAVMSEGKRSDPNVIYPIVEWGQLDPILLTNTQSASVGVIFNRNNLVPQLNGKLLFGDMPSGELFYVNADNLPQGGQDPIRRVLFTTGAGGAPRPLLAIIQDKNRAQGKTPATRADMRFDADASGRIFLLNKADGVLRVIAR